MGHATGGPPRFVLTRGGVYVRAAMVVPNDYNTARVEVCETTNEHQALLLCTHRNARRVAFLINQHVHREHLHWQVVKL